MKRIILLLTLFLLLATGPALAISPTSPQEKTATATGREQEIKEKVQERISQIKEEAKKRAFWGTLKEIVNSTLVLETPRGERRVKTLEETKILLGKKEAKVTDLEIGNFIIAMGTLEKNGNLLAKRIVALAKPPEPKPERRAVFGKVTDISAEEKILVLTPPKKPGTTFEVKVTDKTIITKKVEGPPAGEAGKIKKVNFGAIAIGDRVVAVATREKEGGTFTAKIIHVIPGKAEGLEKETTPTPAITSSPTPTPKKPTPTPTE